MKNPKTIDAKYRPGRIRTKKNIEKTYDNGCKTQTRKIKEDNEIKMILFE
jgi:hypothetical protein